MTLAGVLVVLAWSQAGSAPAGGGSIKPPPEDAHSSRGPLPRDGCFVGKGKVRSPRCIYGNKRSNKRSVLLGDSHASHFFPGLKPVIKRRNWRMLVLTKAGCPPIGAVKRREAGEPVECPKWRRRAMRRIRSEKPGVIITAAALNYRVTSEGGEQLEGAEREQALEKSYARTLKRLKDRTGARMVVMKDVPSPPYDIPNCVADSLNRPARCNFRRPPNHMQDWDARAAREAGARLVSVTPKICKRRRCRAVIRNLLVYRGGAHLTAPFSRSLNRYLHRKLPGAS